MNPLTIHLANLAPERRVKHVSFRVALQTTLLLVALAFVVGMVVGASIGSIK